MTSGAAVFVAVVAFIVPLAISSGASALPGDPTTTTVSTPVSSTSTTVPPSTSSTTSTTSTTVASTTTSTQPPTTTTSPPVQGEGIVVIGSSEYRLLADGSVAAAAADTDTDTDVLAQTGSSSSPVWLTGLACLVSGAFALAFKQRRHLSLYTLRSKRS